MSVTSCRPVGLYLALAAWIVLFYWRPGCEARGTTGASGEQVVAPEQP